MTMSSTEPPESAPVKTSIAPWLSVRRATEAVAFYQAAFDVVERYRLEDEDGAVAVAQLSIDGVDFWVQEDVDASQEPLSRRTVRLILTVANPDAVFAQALAAGATAVTPVAEDHGWRSGRIRDPFGHDWEIGKPLL